MPSIVADPMTTVTSIPVNLHEESTVPVIRRQREDHDPTVRQIEQYSRLTGLPFWGVASELSGPRIFYSRPDTLPLIPDLHFDDFVDATGPHVVEMRSGLTFYSLPLPHRGETPMLALGWVRLRPDRRPDEIVLRAVELGWTKRRVDEWLNEQPYASSQFVARLLDGTWSQFGALRREETLRSELEAITEQIERTHEEVSLLQAVTLRLQLTSSPAELSELCLGRLQHMTQAEGAVLCLEEHDGSQAYLTSGPIPFTEAEFHRLCARCDRKDWTRPFVKNRLVGTPLERELPELRNFVLCSIGDGAHRLGWLMHCNAPKEFGNTEATLLQSFARVLGTHLHNRELFLQHEDLLMGFVRSLVSTIDAKDAYTRGHSERVALVAKCLGEELKLPAKSLEDLYLSGLLHDIGKVGVDDEILRKSDRLTDAEFDQIKRHPVIGCQILAGLQNLQHVLPGVRNHHEAYDGSGYPDRLKGKAIPMMARIISVADAYDAMCSDRPYRKGMPLEKVERIFRENVGPQWDPKVIAAYFQARAKVRKLWAAHRPTDLVSLANETAVGRSRFFHLSKDSPSDSILKVAVAR